MDTFKFICASRANCNPDVLQSIIQLAVEIVREGHLISEIIPEIWLFGDESVKISGPREEQQIADLRIISRKPTQSAD